MNISLLFTLLSYTGISVTNKGIANYKYNIIFDKMIEKIKEQGYSLNFENKEEFINFVIEKYKFQIYSTSYNDNYEESRKAANILSFTPGLNLMYFFRNTEFLIDKDIFDDNWLALATDSKFLNDLQENNLITLQGKKLYLFKQKSFN